MVGLLARRYLLVWFTDMPSMLESQLTYSVISKASFAQGHGSVYYNLFYTTYAFTNMASSLVAGFLVDRWGLAPCVFLFLSFCLFGQAFYALGPTLGGVVSSDAVYFIMFAGRFVFGLGGGSITIAQNTISAWWFRNHELAMAFGCTLTVSRLGSVINFQLTTSVFNALFGTFYNGPAEHRIYCSPNSTDNVWPPLAGNNTRMMIQQTNRACQQSLAGTFWLGDTLVLLSFAAAAYWLTMDRAARRDEANSALGQALLSDPGEPGSGVPPAEQKKKKKKRVMRLSDVCKLPLTFWMVSLIICCFYNDVFPFMAIAKGFLSHKMSSQCPHDASRQSCLDSSNTSAGPIASIVYLMSAVVSPFLGRAVDHYGRRGWLGIFGTGLVLPCFLLLLYTNVTPIIPMILLGTSYVFCAAVLWPSIQFLVPEHVVGTANGLATSMQMLGIGLSSLAVGALMDSETDKKTKVVKSYQPALTLFLAMAVASFCLSILLKVIDSIKGGKLYAGKRDELRQTDDKRQDLEGALQAPAAAAADIAQSPRMEWLTSPTAAVGAVAASSQHPTSN